MARRERRGVAMTVCLVLLWPALMVLTRRRWSGQEHLPRSGGFVLVANHISHADPFLFAHFVHDSGYAPHFLAKASVIELPLVGRLLRAAGQIAVHRETDNASRAFREAVQAVSEGHSIIVYPEGTLTRDPDLWPMKGKTGAARIGLESGRPIIPAAQWGAHEILPPYSRRVRLFPRRLNQVLVGPPVDLSDLRDQPISAELLRVATDRIMTTVAGLLGQLRDETPPAELLDPRGTQAPRIGNPRRSRQEPRS